MERTNPTIPNPTGPYLAGTLTVIAGLAVSARIAEIAGGFILKTTLETSFCYLLGRGTLYALDQIESLNTKEGKKIKMVIAAVLPMVAAIYLGIPSTCALIGSLYLLVEIQKHNTLKSMFDSAAAAFSGLRSQ